MLPHRLTYYLGDYWREKGDPRVASFSFMETIKAPMLLISTYLLFVLVIGPRIMANRPPFVLKGPLLCYNIFMTAMNGYFLYFIIYYRDYMMEKVFDFRYPVISSPIPTKFEAEVLPTLYLYTLSKFIDLFDTVFFILRKKTANVSLLHVYHHASVATFAWIHFRTNFMASILIPFVVMNTTIHVAMYAYYALSTLGPKVAPYLWWKRYLTQLQLLQFAVIFVYGVAFALSQEGYPQWMCTNQVIQAVIYLVLFSRFYLQTYLSKKNK